METNESKHKKMRLAATDIIQWDNYLNKKAVLSHGEPRDAAVNFDTFRCVAFLLVSACRLQ